MASDIWHLLNHVIYVYDSSRVHSMMYLAWFFINHNIINMLDILF